MAQQKKQSIPGVRDVLAVASGKGGVGKSTTAMNLALALKESGLSVGLLDCDFYGPSIPAMIGIHERVRATQENRIVPHEVYGIKFMSMGFMVERHQALSWRGPMLHKMLTQFVFQTKWDELDVLVLDLPPGTGDVQLTLAQSVPVTASVLVTTPQEVALRDVEKGLQMFRRMNVPVLGVIENMSYYLCGKCDKKHFIFGQNGGQRMAEKHKLDLIGQIPLDTTVPSEMGKGEPVFLREPEGAPALAFKQAAEAAKAGLSKITSDQRAGSDWAQPGPGAMEV